MRAWKKMRRSWKKTSVGLKIAVGATVILALSIVGVLANERFNGANKDDAVRARGTGAGSDAEKPKPTGKALELGTVAKVSSNYRVAVTDVTRYETSTGQLVVPTVEATYIGKQDGEPWGDLNVEFLGSGTQTFGESDCPFDLGDADPADQPTLATDDAATYAVCIAVPTKDIKGGKISVEEAFESDDRTFWSTTEAVTKTLPAATPDLPAAQGPRGVQPRRQPGNYSRSDDACEDFDKGEYEDYKEWGDWVKDNYRKWRNAGGDDEDKIEDYEEWEEDYDKQIDQFDKWADAC
jgi:hypothetical protein